MNLDLPVYMHRHSNGSAYPVQGRIGSPEARHFAGAAALNMQEQFGCVKCGLVMDEKNKHQFFRPQASARRYFSLEEGVVVRFVNEPNKQYGFLKSLFDGSIIYFPGLFGRRFVRGTNHNIQLATYAQQQMYGPVRVPKPGDRLLYKLMENEKGLSAKPWGFADQYDDLLKEGRADKVNPSAQFVFTAPVPEAKPAAAVQLEQPKTRQKPVLIDNRYSSRPRFAGEEKYRIIEQNFFHDRDEFDQPSTLWEGTRREFGEIDSLYSSGYLQGAKNATYNRIVWFEKQEGNEWKTCSDPRIDSSATTDSAPHQSA